MAGMMKKLTNRADCVFTGKGLTFGGSLIRPEATGYGTVYFAQEMLKRARPRRFEGLRVSVSGSGNVAQYAVEKAMALGAKVVTVSDSSGTVVDEDGFTPEKLAELMEVKNHLYGRVDDYAERVGATFQARQAPVARAGRRGPALRHPERAGRREAPGAGQQRREVRGRGRQHAVDAGGHQGVRGAARAVRAGQGQQRRRRGHVRPGDEPERHAPVVGRARKSTRACTASCAASTQRACSTAAARTARVSYVDGANIAGFVKVADAMLAQGVV